MLEIPKNQTKKCVYCKNYYNNKTQFPNWYEVITCFTFMVQRGIYFQLKSYLKVHSTIVMLESTH